MCGAGLLPADICAGVTCAQPPGPCFQSSGTCNPNTGECSYQPATGTPCTVGSASGQCNAQGTCGELTGPAPLTLLLLGMHSVEARCGVLCYALLAEFHPHAPD